MIQDLDNSQYYAGYRKDNKPQGFGVLLTSDELYQGMWYQGQFITGFRFELKEQKFSFCFAKPTEPNEAEAGADTDPAD